MARPATRNDRIRLVVILLLIVVVVIGLIFEARRYLARPTGEEIDVLSQCKTSYGPDTGVIGRDDSPTGWHCVTPDNRVVAFTPEDMQAACDRQHPGSRAAQVQAGRQFWRCV